MCAIIAIWWQHYKTSFRVFFVAKVARIHFQHAFLSLVDIFNTRYNWIRQVHLEGKISLNMRVCKFSLPWCMIHCCPHYFTYNLTSSVNTTALDIYNTARRVWFFCRCLAIFTLSTVFIWNLCLYCYKCVFCDS